MVGFARRLWLCYTPVVYNYFVLYIDLMTLLLFDGGCFHF